MKTWLKIILAISGLLIVIGGGTGLYLFNLKPKDLKKADPDFVISSSQLLKHFEENEADATARYVNKIIEVTGEVKSVKQGENSSLNVILKTESEFSSVICTFPANSDTRNIEEGRQVKIRGECSGFLMDVLLNNCALVRDGV